MSKPVTPAVIARIQKSYAKLGTYQAVANEIGVGVTTVRKYINLDKKPVAKEVDPVEQETAKYDHRRAREREGGLIKQLSKEKSFRAYLEDLVAEVVSDWPAPPPYVAPPPQKGASVETMVIHFSDWHANEVVKLERTLGLNEYNDAIMRSRARQIVQSTIAIKSRMESSGGWRFPKLVIAANGDFAPGTMHELEKHLDAKSIIHATFNVGMVLTEAIRDLSGHFDEITVHCTAGNHGRLPDARKKQHKEPGRSFDTAAYLYAMVALRHPCPNVTFNIPDAYSICYDVEGWTFFQGHGDDIRSWFGIPFYGMKKKTGSLNSLRAARGEPVNFWLFGHWHNAASLEVPGGEILINGSLIGGTEHSIDSFSEANPPKQWLYGVHPKKGISHRWSLQGNTDDPIEGYQATEWALR